MSWLFIFDNQFNNIHLHPLFLIKELVRHAAGKCSKIIQGGMKDASIYL